MKLKVLLALGCIAMLTLTGCSQVTVQDYAQNEPKLVLESFFDGDLTAHGVIKNRSGKVIRYFNADIKASWENGVGTLDEKFVFNDGERQIRIWTLTPVATEADGTKIYKGNAGDVKGDGLLKVSGNSLFLDYILEVPYKGRQLDLKLDDRMYLINDTTLINETKMYKFGLEVGSLTLAIIKK